MHDSNRPSSFLVRPVLARLSAKIAPLVQTELVGILIAELERHFNEQLLPELQKNVEAIIQRELPGRMATMLGRVLPGKELSNANKILVDRFTQVFEKNLWGDSETVSGW